MKRTNSLKVLDLSKYFKKSRRAVSPVIAVVLLIALTVAAAAVIWGLTGNFLDNKNVNIIIEASGVGDTDGDGAGDIIQLQIRNIGQDIAKINEFTLTKDGITQSSWQLVNSSYDISNVGFIQAQTLSSSEQITVDNEVFVIVKESNAGSLVRELLPIPSVLSSLPVLFDGLDFGTININSGGWTTFSYNTHGGGAGIVVSGSDLLFSTNDDLLFYLQNSTFSFQNGIISADFLWGDNDAIGIAFRIVDELNYYWVGYTEDHNGPQNRAGETEASFDGPWFNADATFELHKLVNGVDTLLASATPTFSLPTGSVANPSGPYQFIVGFSGTSITFQAGLSGGQIDELISITDTTFVNAGFFGVFSLAATGSSLSDVQVTA